MFTTVNMNLVAWDQGTDAYNHGQLASNWQAVDTHDHTVGRGVAIPTGGLQNAAVTTAKIADGAVTASKIPDGSIPGSKIATGAITGSLIADGTIGTADLASGAVTFAKLDPSVSPLGEIRMWYRVAGTISPPTGWEVCDGRLWSTVTNTLGPGNVQWSTGNMPDFRNRFPLGAALSSTGSTPGLPPDIGQVGGSNTANLAHTHTVAAHSHTVGAHQHGIASDGSHHHKFWSWTWDNNNNPVAQVKVDLFMLENALPNTLGKRYGLTAPDRNRNGYFGDFQNVIMTDEGDHSHFGATVASGAFATSADTAATDSQLSATQDIRPNYVGVLFIMRVR